MTYRDKYGIYSGGIVTFSGGDEIRITPYQLSLPDGTVTGVGSDGQEWAKRIKVAFGSGPTDTGFVHAATQYPQFTLYINNVAPGNCYIYYDAGEKDIIISTALSRPAVQMIVFAKITWGGGSTTISDLTVDTSGTVAATANRNEAYLSRTDTPESPRFFYQDGQKFTAASINNQYANLAVLAQVMQSESLLSFGSTYFITLARQGNPGESGDVYGDGTSVFINEITSMSRDGGIFTVYHTKIDEDLDPAGTAFIHEFATIAEVQDTTIYAVINKETGKPSVVTSYDDEDYYLIAYGQVAADETDLANVLFRVTNNLGGQNTYIENLAFMLRNSKTSGFLSPLVLEAVAADNKIRMLPNIANIDGYLIIINGSDIALSAPPATGVRHDFVYLEIIKNSLPWVSLSVSVKVAEAVERNLYFDSFNSPAVLNSVGNPYVYQKAGHYSAALPANLTDGKSHAIPVCTIARYNTGVYSGTNLKGAASPSGRPDGKTAVRVNLDEVENKGPLCNNINLVELFNRNVLKLLSGTLNNILEASLLDATVMSRSPLQIDRIGTASPIPGSSYIGLTDGIRYVWSRDLSREVKLYFLMKANTDSGVGDYNFPSYTYDQLPRHLTIKVPDGTYGEIVSDSSTGRPRDVEAKWVSTGKTVGFTTNWSAGQLRTSSNVIDTAHGDYLPTGEIAVTFKVKYTDITHFGLKKIPSRVISAASNNNYTELADSFAVALEGYTSPVFIKNITGSITVSSITYTNYLSLDKLGPNNKFHTYRANIYAAGNNSNSADYEFDDEFIETEGTYALIGLLEVRNALTDAIIPAARIKWTYNSDSKFMVRLLTATAAPLKFVFAVGGDAGKQIDLNLGSLEVANLTRTFNFTKTASITDTLADPERSAGIYRMSNGFIVYGASSYLNQFRVYVGEDSATCTIEGIGTNLLKVVIRVVDISNFTSGNWSFSVALNRYIPANGASIRLPVLMALPTDNNQVYIQYQYNASPFKPFYPTTGPHFEDQTAEPNLPYPAGQEAKVANRGILLLSTDGAANPAVDSFSPLIERFPDVQGISNTGINTPASPVGWNDVMSYQQRNRAFCEGTALYFDDSMVISAVVQGGTGMIAWVALIRQLSRLRLFVYEVRTGLFSLNNKEQAFVCDLENNYLELGQ